MNSIDIDALINAAPERAETTVTKRREPKPVNLMIKHGWEARYAQDIELKGEDWLNAFNEAAPIVRSGGFLALVGKRGPGKTQMAAELAKSGDWPSDKPFYNGARTVTTHTPIYRRAIDLFLELRHAAKNHIKSSEKEVLDEIADKGLLIIDEFQDRGESEWESRIVNNLIDRRYSAKKPTIIIANLTRAEMYDKLGPSISDRAKENGKLIEFNWDSFRQPAAGR